MNFVCVRNSLIKKTSFSLAILRALCDLSGMATVLTPLLSTGATGSIGKTLTFSTWKGIHTARSYSVPTGEKTASQIAMRDCYGKALAFFHSMQSSLWPPVQYALSADELGKFYSAWTAFYCAFVPLYRSLNRSLIAYRSVVVANKRVRAYWYNCDAHGTVTNEPGPVTSRYRIPGQAWGPWQAGGHSLNYGVSAIYPTAGVNLDCQLRLNGSLRTGIINFTTVP